MERILATVAEKLWVRVAILGVAFFATALILMPNELRSTLTLTLTHWIGYFVPALVIGGIFGWLAWSRKMWLGATLTFVAITIGIILAVWLRPL